MVDRPFHGEKWLAQNVIDRVISGPPQAQSLSRDIAFGQSRLVSVIETDMAIDIQDTGEFWSGLEPVSGQETGPSFRAVVDAQGCQLPSQTTNLGNTVLIQQLAQLAWTLVRQLVH